MTGEETKIYKLVIIDDEVYTCEGLKKIINWAEYKIEVAAPGMAKEDFNVHITHDNCISIKMEKKTEDNEKENKKNYLRREFGYSKFEQLLSLPENADKNAISAKMNNGVLVIDIPKTKEEEKEKKNTCIEIK